MTVQYTEKFNDLPSVVQDSIKRITEGEALDEKWAILHTEQNRSVIYHSDEYKLIAKRFLPKGKKDSDIASLLDLVDSDYFPNVYAYVNEEYLIMDKAPGEPLSDFYPADFSSEEKEIINSELFNALNDMLDVNRYDWDFKREHIFWDRENSKLTWIDLGICDPTRISSPDDKGRKIEGFYRNKQSLKPKHL